MGNIRLPKSSKTVKNHQQDNLLTDLDQGISTQSRLHNLCAFCAFVAEFEPKNAQEAIADEHWSMALQEELNQFERYDVWELVPLPQDAKIIGTRWVFKNKKDEDGLQINQSNAGIFIHQGKYIKDLLKRFALEHVTPKSTPMITSVKLTKDEQGTPVDVTNFRDADYVGSRVDRKSTSGACEFLGDCLVAWHRKNNPL
ncbi:hypothetical protein AgCh_036289 [Apium graveolens]